MSLNINEKNISISHWIHLIGFINKINNSYKVYDQSNSVINLDDLSINFNLIKYIAVVHCLCRGRQFLILRQKQLAYSAELIPVYTNCFLLTISAENSALKWTTIIQIFLIQSYHHSQCIAWNLTDYKEGTHFVKIQSTSTCICILRNRNDNCFQMNTALSQLQNTISFHWNICVNHRLPNNLKWTVPQSCYEWHWMKQNPQGSSERILNHN